MSYISDVNPFMQLSDKQIYDKAWEEGIRLKAIEDAKRGVYAPPRVIRNMAVNTNNPVDYYK